jgi:predicted transcriptional regulator
MVPQCNLIPPMRIEEEEKMVTRYRDRLSIIGKILNVAADGNGNHARKSEIMYKAFLSHIQLKEYLRIVTESELLSYDIETQTYKITEKGIRFLKLYNNIYDIIKEEGEEQEEQEEQETELRAIL